MRFNRALRESQNIGTPAQRTGDVTVMDLSAGHGPIRSNEHGTAQGNINGAERGEGSGTMVIITGGRGCMRPLTGTSSIAGCSSDHPPPYTSIVGTTIHTINVPRVTPNDTPTVTPNVTPIELNRTSFATLNVNTE